MEETNTLRDSVGANGGRQETYGARIVNRKGGEVVKPGTLVCAGDTSTGVNLSSCVVVVRQVDNKFCKRT